MSYGHAHNLNADRPRDHQCGGAGDGPAPPIDPRLYECEDVRQILAERDIAALYLILKGEGVTQRTIAALTGQSQSEVSEILAGRKVLAYDLLVRIAEGWHPPRADGPLLRRAQHLRWTRHGRQSRRGCHRPRYDPRA